ncbi:hypothetical protein B4135_1894 [Caldibacillus debilis]|uniref:Uncharacterized protein n=1 Tax=Caldibacillus debilis TaxID=301148 RepID=A0A150M7M1_9BACI|nr:hypothetical protein B4135_1894 [Caldibacillus debilis]
MRRGGQKSVTFVFTFVPKKFFNHVFIEGREGTEEIRCAPKGA